MADYLVQRPIRLASHSLFTPFSSRSTIVLDEYFGTTRSLLYAAAEVYLGTKIKAHYETSKRKDCSVVDTFDNFQLKWRRYSSGKKRFFELSFEKKLKDRVMNEYLPFVYAKAREIKGHEELDGISGKSLCQNRGGIRRNSKELFSRNKVRRRGRNWGSNDLGCTATFETMAVDTKPKEASGIEDTDWKVKMPTLLTTIKAPNPYRFPKSDDKKIKTTQANHRLSSSPLTNLKVGRNNAEERRERIHRYRAKRTEKNLNKTIKKWEMKGCSAEEEMDEELDLWLRSPIALPDGGENVEDRVVNESLHFVSAISREIEDQSLYCRNIESIGKQSFCENDKFKEIWDCWCYGSVWGLNFLLGPEPKKANGIRDTDWAVESQNLQTRIQAKNPYRLPKYNNKTLEMVQEPEKASGTGDIDWDVEMDFSDELQARNPYGLPKSNNKKWAAMMECSLGEEMDGKLDSRLQLPIALPDGGEIAGAVALSSIESAKLLSEFGVKREDVVKSLERSSWTAEEHQTFLVGLEKLGKGDWRGISRNFVTTSTPTQVASHAQKYFLRQASLDKKKRRLSLFDMKWAAMMGCSLGEEMDEKLDSRLQLPLALPDGGEVAGAVALSSIESAKSLSEFGVRHEDVVKSLEKRRLTLEDCVRQDKLPDLSGTLQIDTVEEIVTQSPGSFGECSLGEGRTIEVIVLFTSASSSHWPIGSPDGQQIVQLDSLEQSRDNVVHGARADQKCHTISLAEKKIFRKTLKRKWRTSSVIYLEDLQQHYGSRCEYAAKSNCVSMSAVKHICTPLGIHRVSTMKRIHRRHGIHRWPSRLSAITSHWPISLPYGGQIMQLDSVERSGNSVAHGARVDQSCPTASLSEKKMVRRTLKRRCRTKSVISCDELQQHFGSRCEDAVKCLFVSVSTVKYICRQHGIHKASTVKRICRQHWFHRWPFRQKCATMKGCYLGEERSVEVISLSTDGKRDSRSQFIHISQLSRSSHWPIALPDGGEIVGPIVLSSSDFASPNNKARLVREDQRGSTASHSEKKNTREASNGEGISTSLFSLEDLQRLFGSKREDAANILGVSVSTFKRICRHHGIKRWPNRIRNNVWKPPDPQGEKNASPTCKTLSANGQTATWYEMVGHLQEPNEFPPDFIGGPNCWNTGNGSLEDIIRATTFHDSCPDNYLDMGSSISPMFKESGEAMGSYEWAFQLRDQSTVSTSDLNPNALVFPQHQKASTEMVSDNMRISEDWRQPQIASTQMVNENMGISEDWKQHPIASKQMVSENMEILEDCRNFFASPAEAFMEGLVCGSSNWTLPTCSNPALSQTTTTIPHLMPYHPASQDLRSVTLKATYGDTMIRFQLPLMSGIAELKEEVSLRLKLELGSFDVEYKDEDGDWILIGCDKDLRDYLQLFSSFGNKVIRLLVIDKVPNATNFSGSCGLKRKRP